jgi:RNA polymerase sigma factor (sigma-70 family)
MDEKRLVNIIDGCRRMDRASQERLYDQFYNYAMTISIRYTKIEEEAEELVNDVFVKIFKSIGTHYSSELSFKGWLRRITINTAIDRFRSKQNQPIMNELGSAAYVPGDNNDIIAQMSYNQLIELIHRLSPAYRTVFNLYAIDGFKHHEIAEMLGISEGASKSNLSRAREKLQELVKEYSN